MGIAFHQLRHLIRKRVQQAGPAHAFLVRDASAAVLVCRQCLGHALASDAQVLIDRADPEWQDTCRRILECLSSTWGGKYATIIPTDGSVIGDMFWDVLEAFD